MNQFSADARVRSRIGLELLTETGRGDVQLVEAALPNWLRTVLYHVGSNDNIGPSLPAELDVPVLVEAGTARIVAVDVDATAAELERYHALGRQEWLENGAMLAPLRNAIKLPGTSFRGAKGLLGEWRERAGELRELGNDPAASGEAGPPKPSWKPKEIEQMRRTAMQQRVAFKRDPKLREKARASVLAAAPGFVQGAQAGVRAKEDVEAWIMSNEVSELISAEEAAELRREAGLSG